MTFPVTFPVEFVPADTAEYVFRPVTKVRVEPSGEPVVETVMTQIWITQP